MPPPSPPDPDLARIREALEGLVDASDSDLIGIVAEIRSALEARTAEDEHDALVSVAAFLDISWHDAINDEEINEVTT
jgi:hypothetical protein